jgi:hypothetical protein
MFKQVKNEWRNKGMGEYEEAKRLLRLTGAKGALWQSC